MTKLAQLRVSDVVRLSVASSVARFDANEPTLWTGPDPEAVHQARVAARRLRSDLRTLRDFVDPGWSLNLRAELRWLGGELAAVRDVDVLRERLTLHTALLPDNEATAARRTLRRLETDGAAARTELLVALRQPRYARLHRTLHEAAITPRLTSLAGARAADVMGATVRPTWRKLNRAVGALSSVPSDAALHEVRIRTKRCRYAVEIAVPVIGRRASDLGIALTRLQDVLGEHNDAVIADAWLAKAAPECDPAEAFALGMLAEIERDLAVRARAALASAWDAARPRRLRAWM